MVSSFLFSWSSQNWSLILIPSSIMIYVITTGSLSRLIFSNDPILNYQTMDVVLGCYLGKDTRNAANTDPFISPAVADDEVLHFIIFILRIIHQLCYLFQVLRKFPTTVICVGDVDPLIDDSTYFFNRLQKVIFFSIQFIPPPSKVNNNGTDFFFKQVKVRSILRVYRALPHGYLNLPTQLPKAYDAIKDAAVYVEWLIRDYNRQAK